MRIFDPPADFNPDATEVGSIGADIVRPETLVDERPDLFTKAKLKWLIRQREHNGLSEAGAVVKCGRTLFVVKSKFYQWLLSNTD